MLPFYLLCGMSYDEFWYGDPIRAVAYREAHRLRIEQANQQLWLQGLYVYNAVAVAINNAFSKTKQKYIAEPVQMFPPTEEEKQAKAEETKRTLVEKTQGVQGRF